MTIVDYQVAADEDDTFTYNGSSTDGQVYVYTNYNNATSLFCGFRFLAIAVPNSAIINVAYFQGYAYEITSRDFDVNLDMEAIDNPTAPEGGTLLDSRNLTGNSVNLVGFGAGGWHTSPSMVAAVQAVVDRAGWAAGQDMCVIGEDTQTAKKGIFADYTWDGSLAAKLHIEYTAAGGGGDSLAALGNIKKRRFHNLLMR